MVVRLRRPVQRIADERADLARERARKDRRALDDAGVAVARLLAGRIVLVDEHDGASTPLQMQRRGDADHPGAENDRIRSHAFQAAATESGVATASSDFRSAATPQRAWTIPEIGRAHV